MTARAADAPERIRASAVCVERGRLLCVRLRDPKSGIARLFPPGGAIEPGESAHDAAVRETLEETGYRVAVATPSARVVKYPYTWNGVLRQVTTHLFVAELIDEGATAEPVRDASYNEGAVWLPLEQLEGELGYEPALLEGIKALLPRRARIGF